MYNYRRFRGDLKINRGEEVALSVKYLAGKMAELLRQGVPYLRALSTVLKRHAKNQSWQDLSPKIQAQLNEDRRLKAGVDKVVARTQTPWYLDPVVAYRHVETCPPLPEDD